MMQGLGYAYPTCISNMRIGYTYRTCISDKHFRYAILIWISDMHIMPIKHGTQVCISDMLIRYAYPSCISDMDIRYAYPICISNTQVQHAYQICISDMHFISDMHIRYARPIRKYCNTKGAISISRPHVAEPAPWSRRNKFPCEPWPTQQHPLRKTRTSSAKLVERTFDYVRLPTSAKREYYTNVFVAVFQQHMLAHNVGLIPQIVYTYVSTYTLGSKASSNTWTCESLHVPKKLILKLVIGMMGPWGHIPLCRLSLPLMKASNPIRNCWPWTISHFYSFSRVQVWTVACQTLFRE